LCRPVRPRAAGTITCQQSLHPFPDRSKPLAISDRRS
jgi:hypothetical protein